MLETLVEVENLETVSLRGAGARERPLLQVSKSSGNLSRLALQFQCRCRRLPLNTPGKPSGGPQTLHPPP